MAGGLGLLPSPKVGLHQPVIDPPQRRSGALGTLCRSPLVRTASAGASVTQTALPGAQIPKYADPVPTFFGARSTATAIDVSMQEVQQPVLPAAFYAALPAPYQKGTFVWAYKVGDNPPHYPGFTIEARRGTPTTVTYDNALPAMPRLQDYLTVDQMVHWADPLEQMGSFSPFRGPPPVVPHLHGAAVPSAFDGNPDAWFTPGQAVTGPAFSTNIYAYPNVQDATTLWFHDHALGLTRINVYAGLAAFYLIRDDYDTGVPGTGLGLPAGPYEIELAIQDRQFDTNGQWFFPVGDPAGLNGTPPNPEVHPFWIPEFFGDAIVVNGKTWPFLNVEPRRYRFRLLNACNARFFELRLANASSDNPGPLVWQIGTDGGLLDRPVAMRERNLLLAPAERADMIVDFADFKGQTLLLLNSAPAPYPSGDAPDPQTNGQIMQFRVNLPLQGADSSYDPKPGARLRGRPHQSPAIIRLTSRAGSGVVAGGVTIAKRRQLVLIESEGEEAGPLEVLLNNTKWTGKRETTGTPIPGFQSDGHGDWLSELPQVGSTELWEIVNLTEDAHPIHVHLVQFQLLNRQKIDADQYQEAWSAAFPGGSFIAGYGPPRPYDTPNDDLALGGNLAISPFLQGPPLPPEANEAGWKDTVQSLPGEVTRIVLRWAPMDIPVHAVTAGQNLYPFDPTLGPGYVWHCHVLDHEDNEMMRPYSPVR
jgi:FtsP/CotA-like multicopper oxidase with cupredoxin domain